MVCQTLWCVVPANRFYAEEQLLDVIRYLLVHLVGNKYSYSFNEGQALKRQGLGYVEQG